MKFILGKKIQMTQIFQPDGRMVPVTLVQAGPCFVTQIKTAAAGGVSAAQIGFDESVKHLAKPQAGHLRDLPKLRFLKDLACSEIKLKRGDKFTAEIFKPGETVEVTGFSKGKGFQGVVRRHGFHGGPASHGQKDNLRMPGSIGSKRQGPVAKGKRMAGRMGGEQVTIKNLEIVEVDAPNNLLKIKGALPGARNSLVIIKGPGEITTSKPAVLEGQPEKSQV